MNTLKTRSIIFNGAPVPCAWYQLKNGCHWIFYGIEKSAVIIETELATFLGVSTATLKNWRIGHSPANGALLWLAYLHYTGQIMPESWRKDGFYFDHNDMIRRTNACADRHTVKNLDFLQWQLKQATESLRALLKTPREAVESPDKLPSPITGRDPLASRHEP